MSQANYIIICRGRVEIDLAKGIPGKLCAASSAAERLVSHIDLQQPGKLTDEDTQPISQLQHEMMDNLRTWSKKEADAKIAEMIKLMYVLEKKMEQ